MAKIPKGQRCEAVSYTKPAKWSHAQGDPVRCPMPATESVPDPFLEQVYLCKGHKEEFSRFETAITMSTRNKGGSLD